MLALKAWANAALDYTHQRMHMMLEPNPGAEFGDAVEELIEAQKLKYRPRVQPPHDEQLDSGAAPLAMVDWYPQDGEDMDIAGAAEAAEAAEVATVATAEAGNSSSSHSSPSDSSLSDSAESSSSSSDSG